MHLLELTATPFSLLSNPVWWTVSLPTARDKSEMSAGFLSNPNHPVIFVFNCKFTSSNHRLHPHHLYITFLPSLPTAQGSLLGFPGAHLGTPPDAAVVAPEGDTLLLQGDILQVLGGLADVHALDGLCGLSGVLTTKGTEKILSSILFQRQHEHKRSSVLPGYNSYGYKGSTYQNRPKSNN